MLIQAQQSTKQFVDKIQRHWGVSFPEGKDTELQFMAHLWEPLRYNCSSTNRNASSNSVHCSPCLEAAL